MPENPWERRWRDYYQAIGVDATATAEEIKVNYRRKAKLLSPDRMRDEPQEIRDLGEADMKILNEAYEVLGSSVARNEYDRAYRKRHGGGSPSRSASGNAADPLPKLRFNQREVELDVDPSSSDVLTFQIIVDYADSSPSFDVTLHKLLVSKTGALADAEIEYTFEGGDTPPWAMIFKLEAAQFSPGRNYEGMIDLQVARQD